MPHGFYYNLQKYNWQSETFPALVHDTVDRLLNILDNF